MSKPVTIFIRFDGDMDLSTSDVWPDGDAPADVTPEAVAALIKNEGTVSNFMNEWNIYPAVYVSVGYGPEVKAL